MMLLTGGLIVILAGAGLFYLYSVSSNIITRQTESHMRDILQGGLLRFSPDLQKDLRLLTREILSRAIPITEKELLAMEEGENSLSPEDINSIIAMPEYGRIIQELRAIKASTLPADAQWQLLGRVYAKTGEKVLARKCLERVLEIKPDDEKTMKALNKL